MKLHVELRDPIEEIPPEVSARVKLGVRFLDVMLDGPDWVHLVRCDELDLAFPERCILGQLFKDFSFALSELGIDEGMAVAFGFMAGPFDGSSAEYSLLGEAWYGVIMVRKFGSYTPTC